jgi:hypothetical protein
MGKPPVTDKRGEKRGEQQGAHRWPFDPMQPGDHEPARLPEELGRVQKQTGRDEDKA